MILIIDPDFTASATFLMLHRSMAEVWTVAFFLKKTTSRAGQQNDAETEEDKGFGRTFHSSKETEILGF
ncbi:hypothetical protein BH11BAC2_BH11BAC2_05360 [soil metagenome]